MPILEIAELTLIRGKTRILRGVNWRVRPGEHWAILGANGSGKTSLLSALTGYLMPTGGEISVLGRRFGESDWRELRKDIGLVSSSIRQLMADDEPALETVISGKYAMIDFWGRATKPDRARARRLLRQVECGSLAERPWLYLSQGERQRILIGRALMAEPQLLILDEPCAGLDPAAREHFLQFLNRLARQPGAPTLVFVTHHVDEILPAISHVLIMRTGKVLAAGRKNDVLTGANLQEAFGSAVKLRRAGGRYSLAIRSRTAKVV